MCGASSWTGTHSVDAVPIIGGEGPGERAGIASARGAAHSSVAALTMPCRSGLTDEALMFLSLSTSLTDLSLSSNQITDSGVRTLAVFPALVRLDLRAQSGVPGLTDASAEVLSRNTSLTSLDLSENKLTAISVTFFISNTALTMLKLNRSIYPYFSNPPSLSLESQVAHNKASVLQRRKTLLQFLFTVARQKRKGVGPFARVPVGASIMQDASCIRISLSTLVVRHHLETIYRFIFYAFASETLRLHSILAR